MFRILFLVLFIAACETQAQTSIDANSTLDQDSLNAYILKEVNVLRKKVKHEPLSNTPLLAAPATDHAQYMGAKKTLTHYQKNTLKRTPKNRADFYGEHFNVVGENIQVNNLALCAPKKNNKATNLPVTYESLAKAIVLNWKNSPGHYRNMIEPEFKTMYTYVNLLPNGQLYACQMFGGSAYTPSDSSEIPYAYKPEKDCKCKKLRKRSPAVEGVFLSDDSTLFYYSFYGWRGRAGLRNFWRDGIAADILLKSQYTCGDDNRFNGKKGVRGVSLTPVFRKDFRKGKNFSRHRLLGGTYVELGKLPKWVNEEYEVNLTLINKKRTCENMRFDIIPVGFKLKFKIDYIFDTLSVRNIKYVYDTLYHRVYYTKGSAELNDTTFKALQTALQKDTLEIATCKIRGFSSIEGSTLLNETLYKKRAQQILEQLHLSKNDTANVQIETRENSEAFRKDVANSEYSYLCKLNDTELKEKLADKALCLKLEPFLEKHRYADVTLVTKKEVETHYTAENIIQYFEQAVLKNNMQRAKQLQTALLNLITAGEVDVNYLHNMNIPRTKKTLGLWNNAFLFAFFYDTTRTDRFDILEQDLNELYVIDSTNRIVATNKTILEYNKNLPDLGSYKAHAKFYTYLSRKRNVYKQIQARMLLDLCTHNDWVIFMSRKKSSRKYMYNTAKKHIRDAKLTAHETFDLAGYYLFFNQDKYAYSLTKNILSKTEVLADHIFFLKLIQLMEPDLPRKTYLQLFEKIRVLSGDAFCTIFNSPNLNFQILDDPEIKEIYCKQCATKN